MAVVNSSICVETSGPKLSDQCGSSYITCDCAKPRCDLYITGRGKIRLPKGRKVKGYI